MDVQNWLNDPSGPQVYRLFGYAGTGKTTLAQELARAVKGRVLYATFTGKAALVLRKKGCDGASTIHSLIYIPEQCEKTGNIKFKLNWDCDLSGAKLLIIDEVSMVPEDIALDLLKFGVRILVLGDPAQLPPVKGEGFFINAKPDTMLTEVHRQAQDNPIIRMSMDIRAGNRLQRGEWGSSRVIRREDVTREMMGQYVCAADQVLVGLNRTRTSFNQRIREMKGFVGRDEPWHPASGEKLICLKNNREKALFNGGMWQAENVKAKNGAFDILMTSLDEQRPPVKGKVFDEFFLGTEHELDWRERKQSLEFTYGWAITTHKAQGSQWDDVVVFDESSAFREAQRNWLYTAVTRAAEKVTVVV